MARVTIAYKGAVGAPLCPAVMFYRYLNLHVLIAA